jgi:hypothetical protein
MSYLSCNEILEHTKEHQIIDLMSCLFCTFFVCFELEFMQFAHKYVLHFWVYFVISDHVFDVFDFRSFNSFELLI